MFHITKDNVLSLLQNAIDTVDDHEEHKTACYYIDDNNQPMCIVGYVLINDAGVDPSVFITDDGYGPEQTTSRISELYRNRRTNYVSIDNNALEVLTAAQDHQDEGYTWGESYELATTVLKEEEEDF